MAKVEWVFPEVLKYRETKEAAARTAEEAKRNGVTVSEFVRSSMRKTLGLPPPPTIEKKRGQSAPAEANPTPRVGQKDRERVLAGVKRYGSWAAYAQAIQDETRIEPERKVQMLKEAAAVQAEEVKP